jgi:hypothetical protein
MPRSGYFGCHVPHNARLPGYTGRTYRIIASVSVSMSSPASDSPDGGQAEVTPLWAVDDASLPSVAFFLYFSHNALVVNVLSVPPIGNDVYIRAVHVVARLRIAGVIMTMCVIRAPTIPELRTHHVFW